MTWKRASSTSPRRTRRQCTDVVAAAVRRSRRPLPRRNGHSPSTEKRCLCIRRLATGVSPASRTIGYAGTRSNGQVSFQRLRLPKLGESAQIQETIGSTRKLSQALDGVCVHESGISSGSAEITIRWPIVIYGTKSAKSEYVMRSPSVFAVKTFPLVARRRSRQSCYRTPKPRPSMQAMTW